MAAKCDFEASPGRDRFIRFTRLLIAGGTPILREVLKLYHTPRSLTAALGSTRIGFTKPQKQRVFPPPPGSLPNFEDFDISLIFKLLRNCCGLTEPRMTKWNELPVESDVSLEADIVRIDFYRNEVYGHTLETMALTQEDFDKYWNIISDALCRIVTNHLPGVMSVRPRLRNKIQGLKFSCLTDDDRRMVEEHLRSIEASLAEQDKKLDNIEAKEDQIKQGIEGLQDTMIHMHALQITKTSDNQTIPPAAESSPVNYNMNLTFNQFSPNFSSNYTHGAPPGLTQGTTRQFSEGTANTPKNPLPYHKSYSQPANGQQRVSSQERCGNPAEDRSQFQFPPQEDEYQTVSNPVWQSPNQTADTASFYVIQDDSPDPSANEASAARTWTTNPSRQGFSGGPSHFDSKEDRQTSPDARTWMNNPSRQGFSSGPYHINSQDDRQTSPDARTWMNNPSRQGFSSGPYHINTQDDRQTSPDARTWTTSFNQGKTSFNSRETYTCGRHDIYRKALPLNPLVSNKYEWFRSGQQQDLDPLLRIKISVRSAAVLSDFDLANMVQSVMDGSNVGTDKSQFTSYLEERRQLTIRRIEGSPNGESCFIEVSPQILQSLEDLWHDYIVQDLREFIKETVLPEDFRGDVDVNIDSEEYKRCCEKLRPRGFKDSGRQLHSQSFSQVGMACDISKSSETITRSQSVMDLPSTQKNASQELLQLICNHGGRINWQMAKQQLSNASYTELTKPTFQQNMNRYLQFLPNNVIQVRLRFCPKMRKDSTCNNTNCPDLHLCIYYFLTDCCNFSTNCKNSHDISDEHTNNVFKMANLSFLNDEERKQLLRNVAFLAPEFCIYYNKQFNSCTKGVNCPYLHVCKDWVLVDRVCAAGTGCRRAHTFSNHHEQQILKKRNLHQKSEKEIIEKLNEYYS